MSADIFTDPIVPLGLITVKPVYGHRGYEEWKPVCHEMFPQPEQALPVPGE